MYVCMYVILVEDSLDGFSVMWWSAWLPRCDWSQSNRSTALTTGIKEFFGERIAVYFWFLGENFAIFLSFNYITFTVPVDKILLTLFLTLNELLL